MRPERHGNGDRLRKAAGEWRFLTDLLDTRQDALYVHVVRSPYPSAKLESFDADAALTCSGVHSVWCAADLPDTRYNAAAAPPAAVLTATADQTVLTDLPRHVGDGCLAVVLRDPRDTAEAEDLLACQWMATEWADGADLAAARRLGGLRSAARPGDVPDGEREFVVSAVTAAVEHLCLEGPVCLVEPQSDGGVEIHTNCQAPSDVRRLVSDIAGIPMPLVRVVKHQEGGGFGGKQEVFEEPLLALLALRTGRTLWTRRNVRTSLRAGRTRHNANITATVRVTSDGLMTAVDTSGDLNSGAYASHVGHVMGDVISAARALYPAATCHYLVSARFTNQIPGGAFRGYGAPQALLAVEQAVDQAARDLGLSPFEIRRRNALADSLLGTSVEGFSRLRQLLDLAETAWTGATLPRQPDGWRRGVGVATCAMLSTTGLPVPDATMTLVRLNEDGTAEVTTGSCDCGTGSSATIAGLVGAELGLGPEQVAVREGDTAFGVTDLGSFAQRTLFVAGTSAQRAARALRASVIAAAARQTGVDADAFELAEGHAIGPDGVPRLPLAAIARQETVDGRSLVAADSSHAGKLPLSYAVVVIAVDIHPRLGELRPHTALLAADCGTVIDPVAVRGQLEGAFVQGLSASLVERWQTDHQGNGPATLAEHGAIGPHQLPDLDIVLLDQPEPSGPGGAKGVGELGLPAVSAAVANAVFDAIGRRVGGVPVDRAELTSETAVA